MNVTQIKLVDLTAIKGMPTNQPPKQSASQIFNENCVKTMEHISNVDVVLTSPPYNTAKRQGKSLTLMNTTGKGYPSVRYDTPLDNMTNEEYMELTRQWFMGFDKILKPNGVVLYNISYGSENRECMFRVVTHILDHTPFTIADVICWKKGSALPNNVSPNKLTRIWEWVFVFCRKDEVDTFYANKKVKSVSSKGQTYYENVFNFIDAKNNDGTCPYNKATYSTDLCKQLLDIYCPPNGTVYDPFMGSGTTAVECVRRGCTYYGSEISENQVKWANERIAKEMEKR